MYKIGAFITFGCWALLIAGVLGQEPASAPARPSLDYEFFKTKIQPIFLAKRPGHARCIVVPLGRHADAPAGARPGRHDVDRGGVAQELRCASGGWSCRAASKSRLLMHPLEESAGGDFYHNGGKHLARRTTRSGRR